MKELINETLENGYAWIGYDSFLENFFLHNTEFIMSIIFFSWMLLLIFCAKEISNNLKIKKKTLILLLVVFIIGFYLRNFEYKMGLCTDGYVYAESAKFMLKHGLFVKDCALGNLEDCRIYEQVLFPAGYPYLIYLLYLIFGINSIFAPMISAVLSTLTIILVFFICILLFKKEEVGLFSAGIFSFLPMSLFYSNTGDVRSTSLFFFSFTILLFLIAVKKNSLKLWSLVALSLSYTIHIKQENSALLIPMLFGLLFMSKNFLKSKANFINILISKKFLIPAFLFLLTQIPIQYWILFHPLGPQYTFSLNYLISMTPIIFQSFFIPLPYFESTLFFNPLISIAFLWSFFLLFLVKKQRKELIFLWLWFITFFVALFSIRYDFFSTKFGLLDYLADLNFVRYIPDLILPYSILAGFSIYQIIKKFNIKKEIIFPILIILLFLTTPYLHKNIALSLFKDVRAEKPEGAYYKATAKVPTGCLVLTTKNMIVTSDYFEDNSRKAFQISLLNNSVVDPIALREIKNAECIMYFDDVCKNYLDPNICPFIEKNLNLTYLYDIDHISIYNVSLKKINYAF